MSKKDFIITAVIALLSVALIVVVILSKKDEPITPAQNGTSQQATEGNGTNNGSNDPTAEDTDIDVSVEDLDPTGSTESGSTTESGNNGGTVSTDTTTPPSGNEISMDDLINAGQN